MRQFTVAGAGWGWSRFGWLAIMLVSALLQGCGGGGGGDGSYVLPFPVGRGFFVTQGRGGVR